MDAVCRDVQALGMSSRPKLRSCSVKRPRRRIIEELDEIRPRTSSLPTKNDYKKPQYLSPTGSTDEDLHRIRSFQTTPKGIVNRGDSFKSRSTNSIVSSCGSLTDMYPPSRSPSVNSHSSADADVTPDHQYFKVSVLGSDGVGKTSLIQQFMTSEYIGGFDTSLDGEQEKAVTVLLNGEESDLSFAEIDLSVQKEEIEGVPDGYVLIYDITSRSSFDFTVDILYKLRKQDKNSTSIIMAANKSDLVRTRQVTTEEGVSVAKTYGCRLIETSTVVNHHVDELLVGLLSQLRLSLGPSSDSSKRTTRYKQRARGLIEKLIHKDKSDRKSCENLFLA